MLDIILAPAPLGPLWEHLPLCNSSKTQPRTPEILPSSHGQYISQEPGLPQWDRTAPCSARLTSSLGISGTTNLGRRKQAAGTGVLLWSSCHTLCCPHLSAAKVLESIWMKIFIKQTRKSITSNHQILVPWWTANLPASEKCAVLTSDSCKGARYLNEVCTHRSRTRGEVPGSMRLLIKAEHQSLCLGSIWWMSAVSSLKVYDYKNESGCAVHRLTQGPEWLLGVQRRALAREEMRAVFSRHSLHPAHPGAHAVTPLKIKGG